MYSLLLHYIFETFFYAFLCQDRLLDLNNKPTLLFLICIEVDVTHKRHI